MRIEDLNRWQWAVIGLLVGGLFGFVRHGMSNPADEGVKGTISQPEFEDRLVAKAVPFRQMPRGYVPRRSPEGGDGLDVIGKLTVFPPDEAGRTWVTGEQLAKIEYSRMADPANSDRVLPAEAHYSTFRVHAPAPYKPFVDVGEPVNMDLTFTPEARMLRRWRTVTTTGWQTPGVTPAGDAATRPAAGRADRRGAQAGSQTTLWRDPGDGAEVRFRLRPGIVYTLVVRLDRMFPDPTAASRLGVTFNNRPVGPLTKAEAKDPFTYKAILPKEAVVAGEQVLRFTRQGDPVHVTQVEVFDPTYTVVRYLDDAKAAYPGRVSFTHPWWRTTPVAVGGYALGGLLVIGGAWPTLLGVLIGAGFGRPPRAKEKGYDLSRVRSNSDGTAPVATGGAMGAAALQSHVDDLESKLLKGAGSGRGGAAADVPPEPEPAVKELKTTPLDAPPVTADGKPQDVEFTGEFYPVAHKVKKHCDDH